MKPTKRKRADSLLVPKPLPVLWEFGNQQKAWLCALLAVITLVLYWPVRHFEFIFLDDPAYVYDNPLVRAGLTWQGFVWALTSVHVGNWHPVTTLSLMLDSQLFGLHPGAFHLVNVAIHTGNSVLVFVVLRRFTGLPWRSAIVAALFAWHPLHVESVAWVSERKDVLCGFFWLLTMWTYALYAQKPRPGWYLLTLTFFALALASKAMAVTLPFVLLLLDFWPLGRFEPGPTAKAGIQPVIFQRIWEKIPFFALSAAASVVMYFAQQHGIEGRPLESFPLAERLSNAIVCFQRYLEQTFWPVDLSLVYRHKGIWPWWRMAAAIGLVAGISTGAILLRRRAPYLATGWFWYVGVLFPVTGVAQVGIQSMADRYTYLPLIGIFIMLVWGADDLRLRLRHPAVGWGWPAGAVLAGCIVVASVQLGYWQNNFTLFEHTLKVSPDNGFAHKILADALRDKGRIDEALVHYHRATRILTDNPDVYYATGFLLAGQGNLDAAMHHYRHAVKLDPTNADIHHSLGNIYYHRRQWAEAARCYHRAAKLRPGTDITEFNLAGCFFNQGKLDEAVTHFEATVRINPRFDKAFLGLGLIRAQQGRMPEAVDQLKKALAVNPNFAPALDRLAWILATTENPGVRDGGEAIQLAQRACGLGESSNGLESLAAALAENRRFSEAVSTQQKVLSLVTPATPAELLQAMQRRLALYQAGKPYRERTNPQ